MSRVVVLDTELTGLEIESGDRIISLALVEICDNEITGKEKEWFINPEGRKSTKTAINMHGITDDFLVDKPLFKDVAQEVLDFIGNAQIVHHCWYDKETDFSKDERIVNIEFINANCNIIPHKKWINVKKWAQQINPERNSLNDMLSYCEIDSNPRKDFHGALVDAQLTAQYYKKIRPMFT